MVGPPSRPGPPVSHAAPRRPDPAARCCSVATPSPARAAAGPLPLDAAPLRYLRSAWAPSSMPPLRLHAAPTPPGPPPRRSPLKQSRRPPADFFSPASRSSTPECHRHPLPSGERPSELLHPSIDHRLLTPGSPSSCRTHPPSSTTTGATPPPLNTAA
jgi:hypothetical protein